jgi:starch phosphorylase
MGTMESLGERLRSIDATRIWQLRSSARTALVAFARERLARQLSASGGTAEEVEAARHLFSADALTLGFARRFATYKRPNLLLADPERLVRLLSNPKRPVQLILAGKAHPADAPGQELVREWVRFARRADVRPHAIFLSDYDMLLTEQLVQGVDVWINTPRRPWEACGTSGMKVLVNGGLNLSELDGWWAEAYSPKLGWALGDGREHDESTEWDRLESEQLLDLLEQQVVPEFYERDEQGIPHAWTARIRESMATLTATYSANRSVREYVEHGYLPAAAAYQERARNNGELGTQIVNWRTALDSNWSSLRFGALTVESRDGVHRFRVPVHLGVLHPQSIRVELYADGSGQNSAFRADMTRTDDVTGQNGDHVYVASVPANRPAGDYTARIVPSYPGVSVPLEVTHVLWQR